MDNSLSSVFLTKSYFSIYLKLTKRIDHEYFNLLYRNYETTDVVIGLIVEIILKEICIYQIMMIYNLNMY